MRTSVRANKLWQDYYKWARYVRFVLGWANPRNEFEKRYSDRILLIGFNQWFRWRKACLKYDATHNHQCCDYPYIENYA